MGLDNRVTAGYKFHTFLKVHNAAADRGGGKGGPMGRTTKDTSETAARPLAREVRRRLAAAGGRTSHDLGLGRIVGQMVVYLYLWEGDCSLDQIAEELGLSKAAVSVAARQLEHLGLIRRTWREGDRRKYYRTADNIGIALRQGLLSIVLNKIEAMAGELDAAQAALAAGSRQEADLQFLAGRVKRAQVLRERADKMLGHPLLSLLIPNR